MLPRHSILGRFVHPLFEERRTLAGRMSWIGIGILTAFVTVAIFADVISPFDPILLSDERNVPPWANAPVTRNESYTVWAGNWSQVNWGQTVNGTGTRSIAAGDTEELWAFPVRILRDDVTAVGLSVLVLATGTDAGHYVQVEVTYDNGVTWSSPFDVRSTGTFVRVDLTSLTRWSTAKLDDQAFRLRMRHASDTGPTGNVTVDFVGLTVVWRSYWHLMGTDPVGRDVFSRVLHGTRTSLAIMVIGVTVALAVGFPLGLFSGYRGGTLDKILVLIMDSLYSFPGLLFAGLIAVLLGKGVVNIGLAVTVIYVPIYFRVTRSQVLSAREELYVEAAKAVGAKPSRIMFRYIAMNVVVAIPVIFSLSAADAILTAAGLSYLGLGVEAPTPDWGLDLSAAANLIDNGVWWSSFFPGFVIVMLTVGLSFLGEGLNDIVNPLLQKERL
ncbi:MAG TPA: ABC transporter permease [Thermoplasmata archaeon]|jgi:peptide/nickel transport system permease protein|nr:ABC transporter permease [Thermoplasmata archaeon]